MMLLKHTCSISRRQAIEGKGLSSKWVEIKTGVRCLLLPATPDNTLNPNLVVGKDYNAYFEVDTDVREGDKLVVNTGRQETTVLVNGKALYDGVGGVSHIELACQTEGA